MSNDDQMTVTFLKRGAPRPELGQVSFNEFLACEGCSTLLEKTIAECGSRIVSVNINDGKGSLISAGSARCSELMRVLQDSHQRSMEVFSRVDYSTVKILWGPPIFCACLLGLVLRLFDAPYLARTSIDSIDSIDSASASEYASASASAASAFTQSFYETKSNKDAVPVEEMTAAADSLKLLRSRQDKENTAAADSLQLLGLPVEEMGDAEMGDAEMGNCDLAWLEGEGDGEGEGEVGVGVGVGVGVQVGVEVGVPVDEVIFGTCVGGRTADLVALDREVSGWVMHYNLSEACWAWLGPPGLIVCQRPGTAFVRRAGSRFHTVVYAGSGLGHTCLWG